MDCIMQLKELGTNLPSLGVPDKLPKNILRNQSAGLVMT